MYIRYAHGPLSYSFSFQSSLLSPQLSQTDDNYITYNKLWRRGKNLILNILQEKKVIGL